MRNSIKRAVFVAPALLATTQAGAHSGHHMESSVSAIMQHLLSSPYHMGLAIGVALSLAAGWAVWKVRTKKQSNANRNISIN